MKQEIERAQQARKPYVIALGELVIAWNSLQENLADLFWVITGVSNGAIPLAIWHSTNNDRAQRQMLRAAVEAAFAKEKKIKDDILWLVDRANALADQRNDAIHSPFWFIRESTEPHRKGLWIPVDFFW
jgi:hypothetical protein